MIRCVLSVDIGTTSLKVGLFTEKGEVVSLFAESFKNPDDSFIANQWLVKLKDAIIKMKKSVDDSNYAVIAVGVSGNGPTVVSDNGRTVIWNKALPQNLEIPESCKSSLFLPRILAFRNLYPDDFENTKKLYSSYEYLIYKLTGSSVTILPEERFTMAYWNKEQLKECEIPEDKLPEYKNVAQLCGKMTGQIKNYLGLKESEIPVFSAGPDFVAAMIGTNTLDNGKLCERCGSSEGFNYCTEKIIVSENARTLPSVMSGLWNLAVLEKESGRKFLKLKQKIEFEQNEKISFQQLYEDSFSGKNDEGFLVLNNILNELKKSYESLKSILVENQIKPPTEIVVTGGQVRNSLWMQKRADFLGVKLVVRNCEDSELVGDACCALTGVGIFSNIKEAAKKIEKTTKIYYPNNRENENI